MAKLKARWKKWLRMLGLGLLLLLAFGAVDYFTFNNARVGGKSYHKDEDGIWLRYKWYFGERSPAEVRAMAKRLRNHGIKDAYFHVRYTMKDGTLRFKYPEEARTLNTVFRSVYPGGRRIAWFFCGNDRIDDNVDISDPAVRKNMVAEAVWLVKEAGFDGIQWDYEICETGNPHFLSLLKETRAELPGVWIGICSPVWLPDPLTNQGYGWTEEYFGEVAKLCDQVAVMAYDTGMYMPRHYAWLMGQQAIRVTRSVYAANPKCKVVVGVPTYMAGSKSHHAHAENLKMAIKGVREGLDSGKAELKAFAGIAMFADYTTDESEWRTYRKLWVGIPEPSSPERSVSFEQD